MKKKLDTCTAGPTNVRLHRTGIGASYGRWYERTATAAVKLINEQGGINGRPIELIVEDDGTDPKRGTEVLEKFATQHKVDVAYGTLFSHVVIGSSPRAGELADCSAANRDFLYPLLSAYPKRY